ncbi:MAG TPA: hypothetical protein VGB98_25475 [Pyrinomonadaceae bacterium]|jgi:hypothetical protein
MSDYLWDKKGEPDGEVERLEALLGTLAHRPRPLALPTPAHARPSRLFAPWALAAAAALLVTTLAGAAALLRSRETPASKGAAVANETRPSQEEAAREKSPEEITRGKSPAAPESSRGAGGSRGGGASKDERAAAEMKDESVAPGDFGRGSRAGKATRPASAQRRQKGPAPPARVGGKGEGGGGAFEAMSAAGGAPSLFESTRLMTKEQLVYALRLTGAKLRDVRQKTRQGLRQEASEQP